MGQLMTDLQGKTALVTGASRGIGKEVALELAARGAYVVGTATSESGAQAISADFEARGLSGEGMVLDVTRQESVDALIASLEAREKMPSILVNNAGITSDNLMLRMEDNEWYSVIETNLSAVYRMIKACLKPMFRARYGRIVTIGSVVGSCGNPGQANYTAAKAGVIGMSKSVAQEMASRGITVNVVSPGFIETDMTDTLPEAVQDALMKRIPMKRLGQPRDIAQAVAFLVSDGAAYITGETLHVNGGMYME